MPPKQTTPVQQEPLVEELQVIEETPPTEETPPVEESPEKLPVKLQAVYRRIVNTETGAVYNTNKVTDLVDLNADSSYFERSQIAAGILIIIED